MHLIDNVDFVFPNTWHELRMIDNRSYVIDTIIGGSIELDRVYERSFLMSNTMSTGKTWIATWWEIQTLDRFCENTSDWGLTCTAWTTKKVAWYKLVVQKCIGKCSFCELLSDDFWEGSWAIFLIESHSRHCSQNFYVTNKFENSQLFPTLCQDDIFDFISKEWSNKEKYIIIFFYVRNRTTE